MSFPFFIHRISQVTWGIHRWLISAGRPNESHNSPTNCGKVFYQYVKNWNGDRSAKNCQHQVPDKFADRERVHGIFSFKTKFEPRDFAAHKKRNKTTQCPKFKQFQCKGISLCRLSALEWQKIFTNG